MFNVLKNLLDAGKYSIAEYFSIAPTTTKYRQIPKFLFNSRVGLYLHSKFDNLGLWHHQSLALEKIGENKNVVISTGTASGKSLIFRAAIFHHILLNPDSKVIVFYPLKALASDQLRGWRAMATELELSQEVVGRIDGSINVRDRDNILNAAKIVIMTPDVCHAWMMSRLSVPLVKNFLENLSYLVMDEAHTLEGVFGSNFAFLLRRLLAAQKNLLGNNIHSLHIIASSATISDPAKHLKILTGFDFDSITEADEGVPREERMCVHIVCPPGEEMLIAKELHTELLNSSKSGGFITFVDSRKGVEILADATQSAVEELLGKDVVMPYRSGYDSADREEIERRLQIGELRGVVSTSALELGIDLPHLTVGINIGVPATRKAYRQRLGRVGRSGSNGAFIVIAPRNAFKGYGTSFKEYHDLSVEPSYLYLDNRFMQFAHSRCLVDELEALGSSNALPIGIEWPEGFKDVYNAAKPGGNRPPEFDAIAQLGGDSPQRSYPLRNVGEINFKISVGESTEPFGEVNESQALRECYPGSTYLHMGRAYEVLSWHTSAFQPYIKVRRTRPNRQTKPRIKTWINTGILTTDLMERHLLIGDNGFLAECQMQITEKVEGYVDQNGTFHSYQDLRQKNPNMRPRQRNFRTSGVLLCIQDSWLRDSGVKQKIADWILSIFCREYSISPQDIGVAATNVSVRTVDQVGIRGDCLVVFDQTYGSLRFTEQLFINFNRILDRLRISAESEESSELLEYVNHLAKFYSGLKDYHEHNLSPSENIPPPRCIQVFAPNSTVYYRENGSIGTEVEVIKPIWINGQLMYQIKDARGKRYISAQSLEPSADADIWDYAWWDAESEEFFSESCET